MIVTLGVNGFGPVRCMVMAAALTAGFPFSASAVQHMDQPPELKDLPFSPASLSRGGKIMWLAGQTTLKDLDGNDISGKFEPQARTILVLIERTLKRAGGSLKDIATMTVYLRDPRNGPIISRIRRELLGSENPPSAMITVSNFAVPGMEIEIQAIAVIGDECSRAKPCE